MTHQVLNPAFLYWGTPVVIISSINLDGTTNIAPMFSAFWQGYRCILGLASINQTPQNIVCTKRRVLNLPTTSMGPAINSLAEPTAVKDIPDVKKAMGYQYAADKWTLSGLTPQNSDLVSPKRVMECPVQMECEFAAVHRIMRDLAPPLSDLGWTVEVKVLRVHVEPYLRLDDMKMG